MAEAIYEIPDNITELFKEVCDDGEMFYRIIDYSDGMSMDNIQSMIHFLECLGVHVDCVVEDWGTQVVLQHPDYQKKVVIDSGGLGDFFSHSFECSWHDDGSW